MNSVVIKRSLYCWYPSRN